jgi:hypothetical protein
LAHAPLDLTGDFAGSRVNWQENAIFSKCNNSILVDVILTVSGRRILLPTHFPENSGVPIPAYHNGAASRALCGPYDSDTRNLIIDQTASEALKVDLFAGGLYVAIQLPSYRTEVANFVPSPLLLNVSSTSLDFVSTLALSLVSLHPSDVAE